MRRCVTTAEKEYNEETEFACYTVEKANGARSYILQFVRGRGDEQFFRYSLEDTAAPGAGERDFRRRTRIMNFDGVQDYLAEEGAHYALNIVSKGYLERSISIFEGVDMIRSSGLAQALENLCRPFVQLTGVNFNAVDLLLQLPERIAGKTVEGRCNIL